jgi:2-polyprenyl-6-hydroxyphenyl methylase/3-demethylubiquinone-9 3-methyltransferase
MAVVQQSSDSGGVVDGNSSVDAREIEHFSKMAQAWWDEKGAFRPLHVMNPTRISYIRDVISGHFGRETNDLAPLKGLNIIDIGCGGGLVSEPMARLGAHMTGVDASEKNIAIAAAHAKTSELVIDYQCNNAETLAAQGMQFDVVLALEIIEHVADVRVFMEACAELTKSGGLCIVSTLNRTAKSFAMAIVGAEYVLRWLPQGTHHWDKFIRPSELAESAQRAGLASPEFMGMVYQPFTQKWQLAPKALDVNYMMVAKKL